MARDEITRYSEKVSGVPGNYDWEARFDKTTGGFVGITQRHGEDEDGKIERVLLSARQYRELVAFAGRPPRPRPERGPAGAGKRGG